MAWLLSIGISLGLRWVARLRTSEGVKGQLRDASCKVSTRTKKRPFCMYFSVLSLLYHTIVASLCISAVWQQKKSLRIMLPWLRCSGGSEKAAFASSSRATVAPAYSPLKLCNLHLTFPLLDANCHVSCATRRSQTWKTLANRSLSSHPLLFPCRKVRLMFPECLIFFLDILFIQPLTEAAFCFPGFPSAANAHQSHSRME